SFVICYLRDHYGLFAFPQGFWDERDPREKALARRSRLLYLLTHDFTPPLDDSLFMEDVDNDAILSFLAGRGFIYLEAIEADGTICSFGVYLLSAWRTYRAKMAMLGRFLDSTRSFFCKVSFLTPLAMVKAFSRTFNKTAFECMPPADSYCELLLQVVTLAQVRPAFSYKVARQVSGAPPPPPPTIPAPNIWPSTVTPRSATHGGDPMTPQRETPRQSYAASSARSSCLKEAASSFELVCPLEFTDATTASAAGHEISAKKSWPLTDVTWLPPGTDISLCWMSIVQRVGNTGVYNVDVSNLDSIASYDYESSASGQSSRGEGSSISYSLQSPRDPVDFSTPSPAFNSDTSPVNHVPRPTVSRVWSTAATAEAAKDEQLPDSAWSIRLGTYRVDSDTSPERENDKGSKRESGRFPRGSGGVANRWLSAEDPKVLFASKAANDLSQSNATADVTSRSAATVLSTAGSASKRYMRSRTMSNIGDLGSRIPLGIKRQSQRRAFGAGLVDSLD
ncbi:hypothetical protein FOZ60_000297, partial [Perkinsus olseni]